MPPRFGANRHTEGVWLGYALLIDTTSCCCWYYGVSLRLGGKKYSRREFEEPRITRLLVSTMHIYYLLFIISTVMRRNARLRCRLFNETERESPYACPAAITRSAPHIMYTQERLRREPQASLLAGLGPCALPPTSTARETVGPTYYSDSGVLYNFNSAHFHVRRPGKTQGAGAPNGLGLRSQRRELADDFWGSENFSNNVTQSQEKRQV